MNTDLQPAIEAAISRAVGRDFCAQEIKSASGGCIHKSYTLRNDDVAYFVKVNAATKLDIFATEADSLRAIKSTGCIKCPSPILFEKHEEYSFLAMEALTISDSQSPDWISMGQQLAAMHRKQNDRYGWTSDNYIGASPQQNRWHDNWAEFFCQMRLKPQFTMARRNGYIFQNEAELYKAVNRLLADHKPQASLLHGDLWSGNAGFLDDGRPVIYDPACYYGDRETDLAFSEFFGGFPHAFYEAYNQAWPLPSGYEKRKALYNLYHVLNHVNLFGGGYVSQAQSMIQNLAHSAFS